MMKKIIFITGAVRSGKSGFAVELTRKFNKPAVFLATCKPLDAEMKRRVQKHKQSRPKTWTTIEEKVNIAAVIKQLKEKVIILDCLTLWISNMLLSGMKEEQLIKNVENLLRALKETTSSVIIVSNEAGWGIVPENKLARIFRDVVGMAHQKIARVCNEVYLMVSGIPLKIKNKKSKIKIKNAGENNG